LKASETERKRAEEALVQERDLLQALIDNIPDSIYFKDDKNRFIRVNKAKAEHSGITPESMIGKTDFDYFPQKQAKEAFADDSRVMKSNRALVNKVQKITHVDGTDHWFSVTKIPRHNEKGEVIGTMGISRDITTRKQQEENLTYMATHDALTGFANRALLNDHLTLALARAQRNGQKFPIMLLDLDNFKDVNDRLGHSGGDKLLQVVGDRLNGILRKTDTVARMGGDEFLLLLPEITKTEDIDVVAQKILAAFQRPFLLGDHEVNTTTSIGIAIYPRDGKDADSLIKNADIAMYYAKEKGRNNYQYYTAIVEE
jgi:diguanylate cyclase (GGDEF)-like protein/PAS domain S-box-containing protein